MIFVFISYVILTTLSASNGDRRILGGLNVTTQHTYMVYFQKAETDNKTYVSWLCAGVIISPNLVLTSAACVEDVQNLYVIAGYEKYVEDQARNNECVESMLKKVVHICVPKAYDLNYDKLDKWANYDIAVIKVATNIVGDSGYNDHCSFAPTAIEINYEFKDLQEAGRDAMILGWGHNKYWREENDTTDYNQEMLQYAATKIYNKTKCLKEYEMYNMDLVIKKYMICTYEHASFNDDGESIKSGIIATKDGCSDEITNTKDNETTTTTTTTTTPPSNGTNPVDQVGICQNDHGGPLISWVRNKPVVIGIASAFKVKDRECTGPFLFTSTYCSSNFLKCVVEAFANEEDKIDGRRSMPEYCYLPAEEKGFDIVERSVSWEDQLDGPAENEKIIRRPQISLFNTNS